MHAASTGKHYQEKKGLLEAFLRCGEEMLSQLDDWDSYEGWLNKREELLEQMGALQAADGGLPALSPQQEQGLQRLVDLIQALDSDIQKALQTRRTQILKEMKEHVEESRLAASAYMGEGDQRGLMMDYKE